MTDEMMSLRTLMEKCAAADLLREMISFAAVHLDGHHRRRIRRSSVKYRLKLEFLSD